MVYLVEWVVEEIDWDLFYEGLDDVILLIIVELRKFYEKVVLYWNLEFEDIVWFIVDNDDFVCFFNDMYEFYKFIVERRNDGRVVFDWVRYVI